MSFLGNALSVAGPLVGSAALPGLGTVAGIAGSKLLGSGISALGSSVNQSSDRAYAQQLWNQQNAFNDPSQQVKRLTKAGLNPNFILGNASGASGNAQTMPDSVKVSDSNSNNHSMDAVASMMNSFAQADLTRAQTDKTKADTAFVEANKTKMLDYDMPNVAASTENILANTKRTDADTSLINLQSEAQAWTNRLNYSLQEPKMRAEIENLVSQTVNNQEQRELIKSNVTLVAQQILETAARTTNINMDTEQTRRLLPLLAGKLSAESSLISANKSSVDLSNANESDLLKFNRSHVNENVPNTNRNYNLINMIRSNAANAKQAGVNADWSNFNQYWNKATDVTSSVSDLGGAYTNYKNMGNKANQGEVRNELFRQQLYSPSVQRTDHFDADGSHTGHHVTTSRRYNH